MPRGNRTANRGHRPAGSKNKRSLTSIVDAKRTGRLPHEILCLIAQGYPLEWPDIPKGLRARIKPAQHYPSPEQRITAAIAAAPYYAPKLGNVNPLTGMPDDTLNQLLTGLAAEAGVSLTIARESTTATISAGAAGAIIDGQSARVRTPILPRSATRPPVRGPDAADDAGGSPPGPL